MTAPVPEPEPAGPAFAAPAVPGVRTVVIAETRTVEATVSVYVSPRDLERYHQVNPKLAERIVSHNLDSNTRADEQARTAAEHRRALELQYLTARIEDRRTVREIEKRGQLAAVGVAVSGFVLCGVALALNHPQAAIWLGCTMIVSLVASFLIGRTLRPSSDDSAPPADPPPS